jgi:D-xylulose reductase
MVMAAARAHGISKIVAFDLIQKRVDFALKHWADHAIIPEQPYEGQDYEDWANELKQRTLSAAGIDPFGVDIAIEASGAESCMHAGITFVHNGGTCKSPVQLSL